LIRYRAAWVLPIDARPVRDGWVTIDGGRVVALGDGVPRDGVREANLGNVAVMPGLINAHTHLELSYLRDRVAPSSSFTTWASQIIAERRRPEQPAEATVVSAIEAAIDESLRCGTAVVGDISNTLAPFAPLAASPLAGVLFWEIIGFRVEKPDELIAQAVSRLKTLRAADRLRVSLSAHAPYSVAPRLFQSIKKAVGQMPLVPSSVHLAEGAEEVELMATGGGPWQALMKAIGAWNVEWKPPGVSPVRYLADLGFLDDRVLAVHGVQMSNEDLGVLKERGVTLVTCPRSNGHTGAGVPPIEDFYASGVPIAIGTDSLASAPDLSVFAEVATLHALAPSIPAAALLESATRRGAHALGFAADFGTIAAGKRARLLAVDLPRRTDDVEEYLVSGVQPAQIRWLE
jgi:cytosine/adenosine deaminase-related metal-dependent hydrolase